MHQFLKAEDQKHYRQIMTFGTPRHLCFPWTYSSTSSGFPGPFQKLLVIMPSFIFTSFSSYSDPYASHINVSHHHPIHTPHCPSTAPTFYLPNVGLIYPIFYSDCWALMEKTNTTTHLWLPISAGPYILLSNSFVCQFYIFTPFLIFLDTCSKLLPLSSTSLFHSHIPQFQQSYFHIAQKKTEAENVRKMPSLLAYLSSNSRHLLLLSLFLLLCLRKISTPALLQS